MRTFALMAVAALGLSACTGEKLVPDNGNADGKFVTVHFGAEASIEGATKATLTTKDELTFKSAWVDGDALSVEYNADDKIKGIIPATWTTNHFEAALSEYNGTWAYNVVYPAPDVDGAIDFGSARTQKGNAYNSKYDLMKGSAIEENADAGKTTDGQNIVFNMTRQTAIAYFHLTSSLDEDVVSAKLSVEGGNIASSLVMLLDHTAGFDLSTEDLNEITITFEEGTAPKASNFQLWYNVLPTTYTKMTLTVETAGHTMTISRTAEDMYLDGKLYKVVKDIPADKWVKKGGETPVASSYKIEFNSKSKGVSSIETTTKASTFVVTGAEYLEAQPFSSSNKAFYGGEQTSGLPLRIGTSSAAGSITMALSKAGQVNANKIILSAKQFSERKSKLIGVNGSAKQQPGDDYTVLEFPLDGSPLTSIKLDSDGYIFIQSITVVSGPVDNTIPSLSVDQTSKVWAADATDAFVVNVAVNSEGGDWTVTPETLSWATIVVDKTAGTITVTPNGANTAETANEATLTVAHASDPTLKAEISLKQNGKGGEAPKTYTLTFANTYSDKLVQNYTTTWDATRDGFTWTMVNWNNNNYNNNWTYVKAGPKGNTKANARIETAAAMPEAISTITITIDAVTNGNITSIVLKSSSTNNFTAGTVIETKSSVGQGEVVFEIPSPQNGLYYQLDFTLNNTTNSDNRKNGVVQVSKVVYTNN